MTGPEKIDSRKPATKKSNREEENCSKEGREEENIKKERVC